MFPSVKIIYLLSATADMYKSSAGLYSMDSKSNPFVLEIGLFGILRAHAKYY